MLLHTCTWKLHLDGEHTLIKIGHQIALLKGCSNNFSIAFTIENYCFHLVYPQTIKHCEEANNSPIIYKKERDFKGFLEVTTHWEL